MDNIVQVSSGTGVEMPTLNGSISLESDQYSGEYHITSVDTE